LISSAERKGGPQAAFAFFIVVVSNDESRSASSGVGGELRVIHGRIQVLNVLASGDGLASGVAGGVVLSLFISSGVLPTSFAYAPKAVIIRSQKTLEEIFADER
jgi:hypothetical protein